MKVKLSMNKGERISRIGGSGSEGRVASDAIAENGFYRAYFRLWNEQRYYQAHDVLEHIWLKTKTEDAHFFKGLIQAAGAFVHLTKTVRASDSSETWPAIVNRPLRLFHLA